MEKEVKRLAELFQQVQDAKINIDIVMAIHEVENYIDELKKSSVSITQKDIESFMVQSDTFRENSFNTPAGYTNTILNEFVRYNKLT